MLWLFDRGTSAISEKSMEFVPLFTTVRYSSMHSNDLDPSVSFSNLIVIISISQQDSSFNTTTRGGVETLVREESLVKKKKTMSFCSPLSSPGSLSSFSKTKPHVTSRFRASADVPDYLSADWYACKIAY